MAAAFRSIGTNTGYGERVNTTISAPSGIQDGDELIMFFLLGSANQALITTPSFPAGWTVIGGPLTVNQNNDTGAFSVRGWLLRKRASSESGDYTVTHTTNASNGVIVAVSGAEDNASPQVTTNDGDGAGDITFSAVTTTRADAWIGAFAWNWELWGSGSPPGGTTPTFTERLDSASHLIYVAEGTFSGTGSTGNKTMGSGNNTADDQWGCFLVALEVPEAGGGDPEGGLVAGKLLRGGLLMGGRLVR